MTSLIILYNKEWDYSIMRIEPKLNKYYVSKRYSSFIIRERKRIAVIIMVISSVILILNTFTPNTYLINLDPSNLGNSSDYFNQIISTSFLHPWIKSSIAYIIGISNFLGSIGGLVVLVGAIFCYFQLIRNFIIGFEIGEGSDGVDSIKSKNKDDSNVVQIGTGLSLFVRLRMKAEVEVELGGHKFKTPFGVFLISSGSGFAIILLSIILYLYHILSVGDMGLLTTFLYNLLFNPSTMGIIFAFIGSQLYEPSIYKSLRWVYFKWIKKDTSRNPSVN